MEKKDKKLKKYKILSLIFASAITLFTPEIIKTASMAQVHNDFNIKDIENYIKNYNKQMHAQKEIYEKSKSSLSKNLKDKSTTSNPLKNEVSNKEKYKFNSSKINFKNNQEYPPKKLNPLMFEINDVNNIKIIKSEYVKNPNIDSESIEIRFFVLINDTIKIFTKRFNFKKSLAKSTLENISDKNIRVSNDLLIIDPLTRKLPKNAFSILPSNKNNWINESNVEIISTKLNHLINPSSHQNVDVEIIVKLGKELKIIHKNISYNNSNDKDDKVLSLKKSDNSNQIKNEYFRSKNALLALPSSNSSGSSSSITSPASSKIAQNSIATQQNITDLNRLQNTDFEQSSTDWAWPKDKLISSFVSIKQSTLTSHAWSAGMSIESIRYLGSINKDSKHNFVILTVSKGTGNTKQSKEINFEVTTTKTRNEHDIKNLKSTDFNFTQDFLKHPMQTLSTVGVISPNDVVVNSIAAVDNNGVLTSILPDQKEVKLKLNISLGLANQDILINVNFIKSINDNLIDEIPENIFSKIKTQLNHPTPNLNVSTDLLKLKDELDHKFNIVSIHALNFRRDSTKIIYNVKIQIGLSYREIPITVSFKQSWNDFIIENNWNNRADYKIVDEDINKIVQDITPSVGPFVGIEAKAVTQKTIDIDQLSLIDTKLKPNLAASSNSSSNASVTFNANLSLLGAKLQIKIGNSLWRDLSQAEISSGAVNNLAGGQEIIMRWLSDASHSFKNGSEFVIAGSTVTLKNNLNKINYPTISLSVKQNSSANFYVSFMLASTNNVNTSLQVKIGTDDWRVATNDELKQKFVIVKKSSTKVLFRFKANATYTFNGYIDEDFSDEISIKTPNAFGDNEIQFIPHLEVKIGKYPESKAVPAVLGELIFEYKKIKNGFLEYKKGASSNWNKLSNISGVINNISAGEKVDFRWHANPKYFFSTGEITYPAETYILKDTSYVPQIISANVIAIDSTGKKATIQLKIKINNSKIKTLSIEVVFAKSINQEIINSIKDKDLNFLDGEVFPATSYNGEIPKKLFVNVKNAPNVKMVSSSLANGETLVDDNDHDLTFNVVIKQGNEQTTKIVTINYKKSRNDKWLESYDDAKDFSVTSNTFAPHFGDIPHGQFAKLFSFGVDNNHSVVVDRAEVISLNPNNLRIATIKITLKLGDSKRDIFRTVTFNKSFAENILSKLDGDNISYQYNDLPLYTPEKIGKFLILFNIVSSNSLSQQEKDDLINAVISKISYKNIPGEDTSQVDINFEIILFGYKLTIEKQITFHKTQNQETLDNISSSDILLKDEILASAKPSKLVAGDFLPILNGEVQIQTVGEQFVNNQNNTHTGVYTFTLKKGQATTTIAGINFKFELSNLEKILQSLDGDNIILVNPEDYKAIDGSISKENFRIEFKDTKKIIDKLEISAKTVENFNRDAHTAVYKFIVKIYPLDNSLKLIQRTVIKSIHFERSLNENFLYNFNFNKIISSNNSPKHNPIPSDFEISTQDNDEKNIKINSVELVDKDNNPTSLNEDSLKVRYKIELSIGTAIRVVYLEIEYHDSFNYNFLKYFDKDLLSLKQEYLDKGPSIEYGANSYMPIPPTSGVQVIDIKANIKDQSSNKVYIIYTLKKGDAKLTLSINTKFKYNFNEQNFIENFTSDDISVSQEEINEYPKETYALGTSGFSLFKWDSIAKIISIKVNDNSYVANSKKIKLDFDIKVGSVTKTITKEIIYLHSPNEHDLNLISDHDIRIDSNELQESPKLLYNNLHNFSIEFPSNLLGEQKNISIKKVVWQKDSIDYDSKVVNLEITLEHYNGGKKITKIIVLKNIRYFNSFNQYDLNNYDYQNQLIQTYNDIVPKDILKTNEENILKLFDTQNSKIKIQDVSILTNNQDQHSPKIIITLVEGEASRVIEINYFSYKHSLNESIIDEIAKKLNLIIAQPTQNDPNANKYVPETIANNKDIEEYILNFINNIKGISGEKITSSNIAISNIKGIVDPEEKIQNISFVFTKGKVSKKISIKIQWKYSYNQKLIDETNSDDILLDVQTSQNSRPSNLNGTNLKNILNGVIKVKQIILLSGHSNSGVYNIVLEIGTKNILTKTLKNVYLEFNQTPLLTAIRGASAKNIDLKVNGTTILDKHIKGVIGNQLNPKNFIITGTWNPSISLADLANIKVRLLSVIDSVNNDQKTAVYYVELMDTTSNKSSKKPIRIEVKYDKSINEDVLEQLNPSNIIINPNEDYPSTNPNISQFNIKMLLDNIIKNYKTTLYGSNNSPLKIGTPIISLKYLDAASNITNYPDSDKKIIRVRFEIKLGRATITIDKTFTFMNNLNSIFLEKIDDKEFNLKPNIKIAYKPSSLKVNDLKDLSNDLLYNGVSIVDIQETQASKIANNNKMGIYVVTLLKGKTKYTKTMKFEFYTSKVFNAISKAINNDDTIIINSDRESGYWTNKLSKVDFSINPKSELYNFKENIYIKSILYIGQISPKAIGDNYSATYQILLESHDEGIVHHTKLIKRVVFKKTLNDQILDEVKQSDINWEQPLLLKNIGVQIGDFTIINNIHKITITSAEFNNSKALGKKPDPDSLNQNIKLTLTLGKSVKYFDNFKIKFAGVSSVNEDILGDINISDFDISAIKSFVPEDIEKDLKSVSSLKFKKGSEPKDKNGNIIPVKWKINFAKDIDRDSLVNPVTITLMLGDASIVLSKDQNGKDIHMTWSKSYNQGVLDSIKEGDIHISKTLMFKKDLKNIGLSDLSSLGKGISIQSIEKEKDKNGADEDYKYVINVRLGKADRSIHVDFEQKAKDVQKRFIIIIASSISVLLFIAFSLSWFFIRKSKMKKKGVYKKPKFRKKINQMPTSKSPTDTKKKSIHDINKIIRNRHGRLDSLGKSLDVINGLYDDQLPKKKK